MIDTLMAIAGGIILYMQNGYMFAVTLVVVVLYFIIVFSFNSWYKKLNQTQMENNAQLTSYMVESLNGIQTVKAYKVSSIFSSSGGYNSSGNYGGISQDGRSHSSAGMYLN